MIFVRIGAFFNTLLGKPTNQSWRADLNRYFYFMKIPNIKDWEIFKKRHPHTSNHIETILGEEISLGAFRIAHKRTCKAKHKGKHAKHIFRLAIKYNWIKDGTQKND